MIKQYEVLNWASSFLEQHEREIHFAELLLLYHLRIERSEFFAQMQENVPLEVLEPYIKDIKKHAITGVPIQHIVGYAPFYGRDFLVNKDVLIPRFETEELVEHIVDYLKTMSDTRGIVVVDVGTGSGVIAITLKKMFPEMTVYATDISERALEVARKNATHFNVDVQLIQGNFLQPLLERDIHPEIIVSNPPYIGRAEKASLSDTVKNFDPEIALYAKEEGLQAYRTIVSQAATIPATVLRAVFFEIGAMQSDAVSKIVNKVFPESTMDIVKDMSGKDRIIAKKC